jgi:hypothetical protein
MAETTLLRPRLSVINIDILLIETQNIMHSWKVPASRSFELIFLISYADGSVSLANQTISTVRRPAVLHFCGRDACFNVGRAIGK